MKLFKNYTKNPMSKKNKIKNSFERKNNSRHSSADIEESVYSTVEENFNTIQNILGNSIGLVRNKYEIFHGGVLTGLAYIDSMADKELISQHIIVPLLNGHINPDTNPDDILLLIQAQFISVPHMLKTCRMDHIIEALLNGNTVLFVDNSSTALIIQSSAIERRPIQEPSNEATLLGSKESFTEDMNINCSMVIKRLPIPALRFETFTVGKLSHLMVKLLWIEGIANIKIIEEVRSRIKRIEIDFIEGTGELIQLIDGRFLPVFPTIIQTERPDLIAKGLSEGHFAVLCSNSPYAILAPISFWDNFKSIDDYAGFAIMGSYYRLVRILSFLISIMISPMYLAFVTYNHAIIPPGLALSIAAGRQGIPFQSVVEIILFTFIISIIFESGIRIPGMVGFFIGSLSAVIIGQAAVNAGYVSASLIIVITTASISRFAVSKAVLIHASNFVNYFLIFLASIFGTFGVICGIILIIWQLTSLRPFGVPYLYPLVPLDMEGLKDTLIRAPFSVIKKRLRILAPFNRDRVVDKGIKPKKKQQEE